MNDTPGVTELEPLVVTGGRRLSWCETGDPAGRIVLYLHGTAGSRLEVALYGAAAARHGLRLVAWDRPGSGGSDLQPGRTVRDIIADTRSVTEALGVERPVVFGLSGGGSHTLVLASAGGDVVRAGVAINPGPPSDDATLALLPKQNSGLLRLARTRPKVFGLVGRVMENRTNPLLNRLKARLLDPVDIRTMYDPGLRPLFEAAADEGSRQPRAWTDEARMLWAQPWQVSLSRFAVPLHVFAGRGDAFAGFSESLGRSGAVLHWFTGGHISGVAADVQDDLMAVIATLSAPEPG